MATCWLCCGPDCELSFRSDRDRKVRPFRPAVPCCSCACLCVYMYLWSGCASVYTIDIRDVANDLQDFLFKGLDLSAAFCSARCTCHDMAANANVPAADHDDMKDFEDEQPLGSSTAIFLFGFICMCMHVDMFEFYICPRLLSLREILSTWLTSKPDDARHSLLSRMRKSEACTYTPIHLSVSLCLSSLSYIYVCIYCHCTCARTILA